MAKKLSQQETEKLIGGIREAYEAKIRQLNYRIESLNTENRNLRASLAEYKNKESKVGKAIVHAEEKGEEIVRLYRMTAETELKTLKLFSEKWKKLATNLPRCSARKRGTFCPAKRSRRKKRNSIRRPSSAGIWRTRRKRASTLTTF